MKESVLQGQATCPNDTPKPLLKRPQTPVTPFLQAAGMQGKADISDTL
jgi:hypothetical protein